MIYSYGSDDNICNGWIPTKIIYEENSIAQQSKQLIGVSIGSCYAVV